MTLLRRRMRAHESTSNFFILAGRLILSSLFYFARAPRRVSAGRRADAAITPDAALRLRLRPSSERSVAVADPHILLSFTAPWRPPRLSVADGCDAGRSLFPDAAANVYRLCCWRFIIGDESCRCRVAAMTLAVTIVAFPQASPAHTPPLKMRHALHRRQHLLVLSSDYRRRRSKCFTMTTSFYPSPPTGRSFIPSPRLPASTI